MMRLVDGKAIRDIRFQRQPKLTIAKVAADAGISKQYLSDLELGKRSGVRDPRLPDLLARALGVPVAAILKTEVAA